jgi:gliding-associated putative ABC transporter substrate-binding component GldG
VGKIAKTANTFILMISILSIIMVLNFLVTRHMVWRVDLTKEKLYTLTDSSKNIVGGLNDHVNIKAYFSQKLPPYLSNIRQDVEDLLNEYQAHAKGNLRVKFIDPTNFDEEQKRKLMYDGIMPINLQTIDKHKFEVMEAYFGMTINYEDRKETIPIVDPTSLEYDLSAAIKKVSLPKTPAIGIFTNKEGLDPERDYSLMYRSLRKLYEIRPVMISEGQKIPETMDVLILLAPTDFSESELFEIDQFVMRGGKLVCLVDAINLDERTLNASVQKPNITKLLTGYGMIINDDLVEDLRSNAVASFSSGFMRTMINYPYWVSVQENLNQENTITKRLNALVLPWVSSVNVAENKPEGVEITTLASTTKSAFQNKEPFNLNPFKRDRQNLKKEDLGQYPLVLLAEGQFPSAYKGEKIPESPKPEDSENPAPGRGTSEMERKDLSGKTSVLVVPNSLFLRDQYLQSARAEDNLTFIENTVDSMALGQELIGIRTRSMAQRPLNPDLTDAQKTSYKWMTIFGVPVLVILFSLIRIPWVRSRRRYYETIFVKD